MLAFQGLYSKRRFYLRKFPYKEKSERFHAKHKFMIFELLEVDVH